MAGIFPEGSEFNVQKDAPASQMVFQSWPTSIIFSGFEIGKKILTGLPLIRNDKIQNSPAKDVFSMCIPMSPEDKDGRKSWDQTAVLVAAKGYAPYYTLEEGRIIVAENGSNSWDTGGRGQFHLKEKMPVEEVALYINRLMMHQPRLKK
jgi:inosine-uridine nucleoside N-ribohydrolase